jgi:hypothetical protein
MKLIQIPSLHVEKIRLIHITFRLGFVLHSPPLISLLWFSLKEKNKINLQPPSCSSEGNHNFHGLSDPLWHRLCPPAISPLCLVDASSRISFLPLVLKSHHLPYLSDQSMPLLSPLTIVRMHPPHSLMINPSPSLSLLLCLGPDTTSRSTFLFLRATQHKKKVATMTSSRSIGGNDVIDYLRYSQ